METVGGGNTGNPSTGNTGLPVEVLQHFHSLSAGFSQKKWKLFEEEILVRLPQEILVKLPQEILVTLPQEILVTLPQSVGCTLELAFLKRNGNCLKRKLPKYTFGSRGKKNKLRCVEFLSLQVFS